MHPFYRRLKYSPIGLEDLACLWCEVRQRYREDGNSEFYHLTMDEVSHLIFAAGYNLNDIARIATYSD
jgi:hypothetical protein